MSTKFRSHQRGVSLLEVMVSVLILAFGLLGLAAMQTNALKNNQSSFQKTQAIMLTYFITEAIRLDRTNLANYTMAKTCGTSNETPNPGDDSGSSGEEGAAEETGDTSEETSGIASSNKQIWLQHIQTNLGTSACGEITCNANDCTIRVHWNDERGTGGSSSAVIETNTRF